MDELRRRRSLAFVRALARHAGSSPACVERAVALVGEDPAAAAAADLLEPGRTWALTRRGAHALERLRSAYAAVLGVSRPAADAFADLDAALAEARSLLSSSERSVDAGGGSPVDLVSREGRDALALLVRDYVSALCHLVACLYGTEALAPLVGVDAGAPVGTDAVLAAADRVVEGVSGRPALGCWTIERYRDGGLVLPASHAYVLDWSGETLDAVERANQLVRAAPLLCVSRAPGARVVLAGRGNVVGTAALSSSRLRDGGEVTDLAPTALVGRPFDLTDPVGSLRDALGGDAFCLPPEQLALALDRAAHERAARRVS